MWLAPSDEFQLTIFAYPNVAGVKVLVRSVAFAELVENLANVVEKHGCLYRVPFCARCFLILDYILERAEDLLCLDCYFCVSFESARCQLLNLQKYRPVIDPFVCLEMVEIFTVDIESELFFGYNGVLFDAIDGFSFSEERLVTL